MAQGGPIPGPAVRNTNPDPDDFGLVVRVVGSGGVGVLVAQGTVPWTVSDPLVEAALNVNLSTRASEATLAALNAMVTANLDVPLSTRASEATLATRASEATLATRASEATLASRLADATFTARINTLGQKTMANSTPIVIASDQSAVPISAAALPLPAGAATEATLATRLADATFTNRINTLGQKTMANSTPIVIASDQSAVPISAAALPLPAGAATEATLATRATETTLATRLADATFTARVNTLGQKTMANSTPITIASDQSSIPVTGPLTDAQLRASAVPISATQLPVALVGGRLDENVGAWLGSTAPTVGQKTMANSVPMAIASDQSAVPVSGTITITDPAEGNTGAAVPAKAIQSGGSDGTNLQALRMFDADSGAGTQFVQGIQLRKTAAGGSVEAGTSTDPLRTDPTGTTAQPVTDNGGSLTVDTTQLPAALVGGRLDNNLGAWLGNTTPTVGQKTMASSIPVAIASDQSAVTITDPAEATPNTAVPGKAIQVGGSDGTNLQTFRTFDVDTGAGTQFVQGISLRKAAAGGSVEAGTSTDPLRVDPTGTTAQPVTDNGGSLTVDTGQLPAALVGGRLDENVGAWLGSTAPTVGQKTMANSIPVAIASDQSAVAVSGTVTITDPAEGNTGAAVPAKAIQSGGSDGTNLQALRMFDADTGVGTQFLQGVQLRKSAAGGSVEAGTSTDPLRVDPTGTTAQPVTDNGGSLTIDTGQLPAALVGGRLDENIGAWLGSTAPTVGQKTMANSVPVAIASDQSAVSVTDARLPAALVGGRLDINVGAWLGSTAPTVGQKTAANSVPTVLASDQSAIPVTDNGGSLTVDTPQLPGALVGGRLDNNIGAWLGSTAPTVGQKTMANSIPVTMASDQTAIQVSGTEGPVEQDTYGGLVSAPRVSQLAVDFTQTIANNPITSTVTNGGTNTQATGSATISTGANVSGTAKLNTNGSTVYQPGHEIYVQFTAAFTTPTSANSNQRAGHYDTNNGFFVGFAGLTFGSTIRTGAADTFTARASWNGDLLTGAAGSKFTRGGTPEAIDLTKRNVYRIRYGWLGDSPIRYEVLSPDGQWVLFNTIRQPNLVTTPSIQTPNLPITMEAVKAAADATVLSITTSSWDAGIVSANPPGTLANGAETAVSNVAVSILAANPTRKAAMVQNTGSANIRVGITGVTATTGFQLTPGSSIVFQMPFCPLQQLFAIREGGTDSTAFAQEIT